MTAESSDRAQGESFGSRLNRIVRLRNPDGSAMFFSDIEDDSERESILEEAQER